MGGWGIWVDVPVKTLRGHGENSIHRRYETPQMYVSLTLTEIIRYPRKRPCNRGIQGLLGRNIRGMSEYS